MIRKNTIDFKLILIKILKKSGYDIYYEACDEVILQEEVCPTCGRKGCCSPYGHYTRYLIDFKDGSPHCAQLSITRVMCECGHTHAILPDPVVPYLQYSLFYVLMVLAVYSCHLMTIDHLCEAYHITPPILYRWLKVYKEHRCEWQGLLESTSSDIRHSLYELSKKDSYSSFAIFFIQKAGVSLLQSHANPANCQQNLQFHFLPEAFNTTC